MEVIKPGNVLSKGEFCDIIAATNTANGKEVHLVRVDHAQMDKIDLPRFDRLSQVAYELNSPHLLKYYKIVRREDQITMVLERPKGISIKDVLLGKTNRRMSEAEARVWLHQLLNALEYLHTRGITHRNIHMSSVFVDADMKALQLGDFLVMPRMFRKTVPSLGHTYHFCALENWMAEDRDIGPAADVWSLGVLLYLMTCGNYPFSGNSDFEICSSVHQGYYSIPNFLSDECTSLLKSLLVPDPTRRLTLAAIRSHPFFAVGQLYFPSGHNVMAGMGAIVGMPPIPEMMEEEDLPTRRTSLMYTEYPRFVPEPVSTPKSKKSPSTPKKRRQSDSILTSAEVKDLLGIGNSFPVFRHDPPTRTRSTAALLESIAPREEPKARPERRHSIDSVQEFYARAQFDFPRTDFKEQLPAKVSPKDDTHFMDDFEHPWITDVSAPDMDKVDHLGLGRALEPILEGDVGGNIDMHPFNSNIDFDVSDDQISEIQKWLSDTEFS